MKIGQRIRKVDKQKAHKLSQGDVKSEQKNTKDVLFNEQLEDPQFCLLKAVSKSIIPTSSFYVEEQSIRTEKIGKKDYLFKTIKNLSQQVKQIRIQKENLIEYVQFLLTNFSFILELAVENIKKKLSSLLSDTIQNKNEIIKQQEKKLCQYQKTIHNESSQSTSKKTDLTWIKTEKTIEQVMMENFKLQEKNDYLEKMLDILTKKNQKSENLMNVSVKKKQVFEDLKKEAEEPSEKEKTLNHRGFKTRKIRTYEERQLKRVLSPLQIKVRSKSPDMIEGILHLKEKIKKIKEELNQSQY